MLQTSARASSRAKWFSSSMPAALSVSRLLPVKWTVPRSSTGSWEVDRLWERVTLPRYPERLVGNPHPHQLMAAAVGPAAELWHGVTLTAWYECEGPYSRSSLSFISRKYGPQLAALYAAGTPVDPTLFKQLLAAEALLGPEEERHLSRHESQVDTDIGTFTMTTSYGSWIRRDGFEHLRDIVTRLAAQAANHWCGSDLGALYTAIGEPAPVVQQRPDRFADQEKHLGTGFRATDPAHTARTICFCIRHPGHHSGSGEFLGRSDAGDLVYLPPARL